jgi:aminoglycoside phosphotransferase (APT) family kinase protein
VSGPEPEGHGPDEAALRDLLARLLPGRDVRRIEALGSGWDNVAVLVDGELVVRTSRLGDGEERHEVVAREAELLTALVHVSPLPTPELVAVRPEEGVLVYRHLPGVVLSGRDVADPDALADAVAGLITTLHGEAGSVLADLVEVDDTAPEEFLAEAVEDWALVAAHVPRQWHGAVEAHLAAGVPPAATRFVFCHHDLGSEHVLVDPDDDSGARVTGVIDWTDAAVADPAYDVALMHRDLGPDFAARVLARYGGGWDDDHQARLVFHSRCALLEDIAYGLRTGRTFYVEEGLAHLPRTFA